MHCPKCGFQQNEGVECLRCGIIFERYHADGSSRVSPVKGQGSLRTVMGRLFRFYRVFRWFSLGILIIALILIFHASKPPSVVVLPDASQQAETKIEEFYASVNQGTESRLELSQSELNGWLGENLGLKKPDSHFLASQTQESLLELAKTAAGGQRIDQDSFQQAQSSVRDIKIQLRDDKLLLYTVFDMHGMDMSLELEGRLSAQDGYLRIEPTAGKLGSLPLMMGTLQAVASRLCDSPENREKFKLPPYIEDIRIEHGSLIVSSR